MPRTGTDRFRLDKRVRIETKTDLPKTIRPDNTLFSRLNKQTTRQPNEPWSGEATRNQGFAVEEARVDVTIGGSDIPDAVKQKDRPVWMTESTVITNDPATMDSADSILEKAAQTSSQGSGTNSASTTRNRKENEDIMSVLLQHEKQQGIRSNAAVKGLGGGNSSDSSDDENDIDNTEIRKSHSEI